MAKARKKRQPAGLARYWAKKRKKKNARLRKPVARRSSTNPREGSYSARRYKQLAMAEIRKQKALKRAWDKEIAKEAKLERMLEIREQKALKRARDKEQKKKNSRRNSRRNSRKLPKHVHLPITLSKKQRSKLARALSAITGKRVHVQ